MEKRRFSNSEEIDLKEIFLILWNAKYFIATTFILASILSVIYALSLPNIYKSSAILTPVSHSENSMSALSDVQMGTLANITGISIPSSNINKAVIGIEVMRSRQFFSNFGLTDEFLVPLIASRGWEMSTDTLVINEEIYNLKQKNWVRDARPPRTSKPSLQEAHKKFMSLFSISRDVKTGLITLSIDHYSPNIAKKWLEEVIFEINNSTRYKDIANAELSIDFLNEEINNTQNTGLLVGLNQMIQSHTEKKVFARATKEYVFQVIDPPHAPEIKSSPRRSIICIIGAIVGTIFGVLVALLRHYFFNSKRPALLQ